MYYSTEQLTVIWIEATDRVVCVGLPWAQGDRWVLAYRCPQESPEEHRDKTRGSAPPNALTGTESRASTLRHPFFQAGFTKATSESVAISRMSTFTDLSFSLS